MDMEQVMAVLTSQLAILCYEAAAIVVLLVCIIRLASAQKKRKCQEMEDRQMRQKQELDDFLRNKKRGKGTWE